MAFFGLVFLVVALLLIGVGAAIGLMLSLVAAGLVGMGVLSSSVLIGMRSGRVDTALRALLLQCGMISDIPVGAVIAWLVQAFFNADGSSWQIFVYGGIAGAFAGLVVALLLDLIWRRLHSWASAHLGSRSG